PEVTEYCIFNRNQNACNYGVFMGSMAFLCCVAFLALDVYFPQISMCFLFFLLLFTAFWSFMWFVGFCFLANQWQVTKLEDNPLREGGDAARAAITFSFFSIFTWYYDNQIILPPPDLLSSWMSTLGFIVTILLLLTNS
uniref:Synaptogyrin 1b n=1 Tax=Salarias fasciatus TaxID=181472 RepID=A0A672FWV8_SALFA